MASVDTPTPQEREERIAALQPASGGEAVLVRTATPSRWTQFVTRLRVEVRQVLKIERDTFKIARLATEQRGHRIDGVDDRRMHRRHRAIAPLPDLFGHHRRGLCCVVA